MYCNRQQQWQRADCGLNFRKSQLAHFGVAAVKSPLRICVRNALRVGRCPSRVGGSVSVLARFRVLLGPCAAGGYIRFISAARSFSRSLHLRCHHRRWTYYVIGPRGRRLAVGGWQWAVDGNVNNAGVMMSPCLTFLACSCPC